MLKLRLRLRRDGRGEGGGVGHGGRRGVGVEKGVEMGQKRHECSLVGRVRGLTLVVKILGGFRDGWERMTGRRDVNSRGIEKIRKKKHSNSPGAGSKNQMETSTQVEMGGEIDGLLRTVVDHDWAGEWLESSG